MHACLFTFKNNQKVLHCLIILIENYVKSIGELNKVAVNTQYTCVEDLDSRGTH